MSSRRAWYRTPWVFAVCGAGLLLLWFGLKWLMSRSDTDAGAGIRAGGRDAGSAGEGTNPADLVSRSDVFWAESSDILFWVAIVLIATAVIVRIWRLIRHIRR